MNPFNPEMSPMSELPESEKIERFEKEKEGPNLEIYLGRHPDKPIKAEVSPKEIAEYKEKGLIKKEMSDEAVYHKLRHDKGGAPITPENKIASLSLEGIYQAHDYTKDVLSEAIKKAPEGSVIIDFATSELERTKEAVDVMRHELEAKAKKEGKKVKIMDAREAAELAGRHWDLDYLNSLDKSIQPWLEKPPGEKIAPDPNKVAKEIDNWTKKITEFAATLPKGEKYIAVGISHGGILDAYLKKQTGKLPSELGGDMRVNEFMQIRGFNKKKPILSYRGESYTLKEK